MPTELPEVKLEAAVGNHNNNNNDNADEDENQPSATLGEVKVVATTEIEFLDMTRKINRQQGTFEAKLVAEKKQERIRRLAFSPDGKLLAAASYGDEAAHNKVVIYNAQTLEIVKTLDDCYFVAAFSHDSKFLVSFSNVLPFLLMVYSVAEDFKKVSEIEVGGTGCYDLTASPFNPNEFLVGASKKVHLVSISSKQIIWSAELADFVYLVYFLTADKVLSGYRGEGNFAVIQNGAVLKHLQHGNSSSLRFAVFANSPRFVSVDHKQLIFWNSQTFEKISSVDLSEEKPFDVRVLPNDRAIMMSAWYAPGGFLFLDSETGKRLDARILNKEGEKMEKRRNYWMALHPSGNSVAVMNTRDFNFESFSLYSLNIPAPLLGVPFMPTQAFKTPIANLEFAQDGMSVIATDVQNKKRNIELDFGTNDNLFAATQAAVERRKRLHLESELVQERRWREEERRLREEKERENEELKRQLAEARASAATAASASGGGGSALTAKRRERESEKSEN